MPFSIETERLILRDFLKEDTEIIVKQFAEPVIRNQILNNQADKNYTREYVRRSIIVADQQPRTYFALAVTLKNVETVIGSCSIYNVYPESVDCAIGWNFDKNFWGKGYATEISKVLISFGFEVYDVSLISAECFADNGAAMRVLEKSGMTLCDSDFISQWRRAMKYRETKSIIKYCIWGNQLIEKIN